MLDAQNLCSTVRAEAPSGANAQPWEFIIIKKTEIKKRIIEIFEEQFEHMRKLEMTKEPESLRIRFRPPTLDGSVFILPVGDMRTLNITNIYARITRGTEIFTCDMAYAFMYMMLAANSLGLGARWASAVNTPYGQTFIKKLLGIPEQLILFDMLVVGYPDEEPKPRRMLRAREEIVRYDHYDESKFRTDQEVLDFLVSLRRK